MFRREKITFLSVLFIMFCVSFGNAQANIPVDSTHQKNEKFNPGEFIIEHVLDNHEWHIADVGSHVISIPLPVIVYSYKQQQWLFFSSGEFCHGGKSYHGLAIASEGDLKGKIIEVNENGEADATAKLPLDISITKNVAEIFIIALLLFWIFFTTARYYKKHPNHSPKKIASFVEPLILFIRDDVARPSIGDKKYAKYMPYLLTVFFFIFCSNLMGIIPVFPGGANATGNIAITMVLALFTFVITTFSGNKNYWTHIINAPGVPWWLKIPIPLMPIVEIIGVFTKPFVLMVRLFANILAGHIIALGFFCLIFIFGAMHWYFGYGISVLSVAFTVFMSMLEILVALIQAYVFTLLSALYFGMATEEHHHEK